MTTPRPPFELTDRAGETRRFPTGRPSLIAFITYALDKAAARAGRWRTQESTLHLLALIGGWPGALLAQRQFRHKTAKTSFLVIFWATVLLNCGALGWLLTANSNLALRTALGAG